MKTGPITVLVADDEPLARRRLLRLLRAEPDIEVVAECKGGQSAVEQILARSPDLVFLDIQMPDLDGFGVIAEVGAARMPAVVFVTAFDQYAVEAFERGAIDYVLKPFNEERLATTVARLKERLGGDPPSLDALVEQLAGRLGGNRPEHLRWIKASVGSQVRLIPVEEVLFFQSDEKYTRVVTCEGEALIRKPIRELLDELDPARFWQIHRATIVNVDHIAGVRRGLKDQAELSVKGHSQTLTVSRAFTHLFKQM